MKYTIMKCGIVISMLGYTISGIYHIQNDMYFEAIIGYLTMILLGFLGFIIGRIKRYERLLRNEIKKEE